MDCLGGFSSALVGGGCGDVRRVAVLVMVVKMVVVVVWFGGIW